MNFLRTVASVALALVGLIALGYCIASLDPQQPHIAGATLRVDVSNGHGSGVHIGNGFILTAAHVVEDEAQVTVKTDKGEKFTANVLWRNKAYDVALLSSDARPGVARLECANPIGGEHVVAIGNPNDMAFVRTYGHIAVQQPRKYGPWESVIVVDITVGPGVSGGPLLDDNGRVAGIVVGLATTQMGPLSISTLAYSFAVPATAVCKLLARV